MYPPSTDLSILISVSLVAACVLLAATGATSQAEHATVDLVAPGRKGMAGQFEPKGPVLLEFLGDCQGCFGNERF